MSKKLTDRDFCEVAEFLDCSVASIKAVATVESGGRGGFDSQGRVLIRFEGHKFRGYTNGRYDRTNSGVSYRYHTNHRTCGKNHGYGGFNEAFRLDPTAAMLSTSYGMFQPMGFNHAEMGYPTVNAMLDDFKKGEKEQLLAFARLIKKWKLDDELRRAKLADFTTFARMYNGSDFASNNYHNKMFDNYKKFSKQKIDCKKLLKEKPLIEKIDLSDKEIDNLLEIPSLVESASDSDLLSVEQVREDNQTIPGSVPSDSQTKVEYETEKQTSEGKETIQVTKTEPKGEPPGKDTKFKIEDLKPFVKRWLARVWTSFSGVNFTQGIGNLVACFQDLENWQIYVAVFLTVLFITAIIAVIVSVVFGFIWLVNRLEIKEYLRDWVANENNPDKFNYELEFEKK